MSSINSSAGQNQSNQKTKFLGRRVHAGDLQVNTLTIGTNGTGSGWLPYTPVITGGSTNPVPHASTTIKAVYQVVGKRMRIHFRLNQSSAGSVAGDGVFIFSIPNGYSIGESAASVGRYLGGPAEIQSSTGNGKLFYGTSIADTGSNTITLVAQGTNNVASPTFTPPLPFGAGASTLNVPFTTPSLNIAFTAEFPIV